MTAPSSRPDAPAQQHADTVRVAIEAAFYPGEADPYESVKRPAIDALDALLKEVERLTAERDEAMASNAVFMSDEAYSRLHDAWHVEQERAEAAEALAERRGAAATLARSELDWCIGYASTVEHKAWRERLLKRLHVARAALAEDASHQDAGEPGYGGQQKEPDA